MISGWDGNGREINLKTVGKLLGCGRETKREPRLEAQKWIHSFHHTFSSGGCTVGKSEKSRFHILLVYSARPKYKQLKNWQLARA